MEPQNAQLFYKITIAFSRTVRLPPRQIPVSKSLQLASGGSTEERMVLGEISGIPRKETREIVTTSSQIAKDYAEGSWRGEYLPYKESAVD